MIRLENIEKVYRTESLETVALSDVASPSVFSARTSIVWSAMTLPSDFFTVPEIVAPTGMTKSIPVMT